MSLWTDSLDLAGQPHLSVHRDGHRVVRYAEGWWAYHVDYRYAPPGQPAVGPAPVGPFPSLDRAKRFVAVQGFQGPLSVEAS